MAESATGIFQEVEFSQRLAAFGCNSKKTFFFALSHTSVWNVTLQSFSVIMHYIWLHTTVKKYNIKHFEDERFSALNCLYPDIIRFLLGDKKEIMLLNEAQMTPLSNKEAIYCF